MKRSRAWLAGIALVALAPLSSCTCKSKSTVDAGPPAPLLPTERLPFPEPWTFTPMRGQIDVAAPIGCRARGAILRATVPPSMRFITDRSTLGALLVGDATGDPPRLINAGLMTLNDKEPSKPAYVPWPDAASAPRFAREGDHWLAALTRPGEASLSAVAAWREGQLGSLGEGDGFDAVDLACGATACALLTTRIAKVASHGATVWTFDKGAPFTAWRAHEIALGELDAGASDGGDAEEGAHPLGLASAPDGDQVIATLVDKSDVLFVRVPLGDGAPAVVARVPASHGAIDALALPSPAGVVPIALTYGSPLDDDGCAKATLPGGNAGVRVERAGGEGALIRLPVPPLGGFVRKLGKGALVTYIAELTCNKPRRVVTGVVLDERGAPVGDPIPIGDATSYAVATDGANADLYLQEGDTVTWMRLSCAP
jgi:hypothetical protein